MATWRAESTRPRSRTGAPPRRPLLTGQDSPEHPPVEKAHGQEQDRAELPLPEADRHQVAQVSEDQPAGANVDAASRHQPDRRTRHHDDRRDGEKTLQPSKQDEGSEDGQQKVLLAGWSQPPWRNGMVKIPTRPSRERGWSPGVEASFPGAPCLRSRSSTGGPGSQR